MSEAIDWYRGEYFFARRRRIYEIDFEQLYRVGMMKTAKSKELAHLVDDYLKEIGTVPKSAILLAISMPIMRHTIALCYEDNSFPEVEEGATSETVRVEIAKDAP